LLAALLFLPRQWLAGVVAVILGTAALEWARLCRLGADGSKLYAAAVITAYLILVPAGVDRIVFAAGAAFWLFVAIPWVLPGGARSVSPAGAAFWLSVAPPWVRRAIAPARGPVLALAGSAILLPAGLAMVSLRPAQLILVIALTSIADTAAYFCGRAWGRHK